PDGPVKPAPDFTGHRRQGADGFSTNWRLNIRQVVVVLQNDAVYAGGLVSFQVADRLADYQIIVSIVKRRPGQRPHRGPSREKVGGRFLKLLNPPLTGRMNSKSQLSFPPWPHSPAPPH